MKLYNNVFASSFSFYSRFKGEAPLTTSICLVWVSQITLAIFVFILIGKIIGTNLFQTLPNKYYYLPLFILWVFILFKYYSQARVDKILMEYKFKPVLEKKIWGMTTLVLFLFPMILIFILLMI